MTNLPENTQAFLYKEGTWRLPGADDVGCEGAKFHSPQVLFCIDTPLALRSWWPEDAEFAHWVMAPRAWLCGNCAANVDILLQMLHATKGELPWEIRREFGNDLRALALKGWAWFAEHHLRWADE